MLGKKMDFPAPQKTALSRFRHFMPFGAFHGVNYVRGPGVFIAAIIVALIAPERLVD